MRARRCLGPFGFDVHAMIWSEDAPRLERALHLRLDACRVNRINYRREFFACDMQRVREVLTECAPHATFTEEIEAEQFRRSKALRDGVDAAEIELQVDAA